ncbi:MAG: FAD-dependent monooxygenase [Burkholderiales bacterium]|nr:FAD-dependent monooxygenase [Burkholderiales bacterium]MDE2565431.1 FAD-dependent monooxygenase [Burkholderiales bacterium]
MSPTAWRIAVVGAGPVGLALALHAARLLPHAQITLFDARPAGRDLQADPRTLALALGSLQFLQRLGVGAAVAAASEPILEVHVSQQAGGPSGAELLLRAADLGVAPLGAVLGYGALVAPLQAAWQAEVAAQPARLSSRFGTPVRSLKPGPEGVEVDAGIAEPYDLAVLAEGGVYAEQARRAVVRDYGQTAWVGTVALQGAVRGRAYERFTAQGPAALLPLPPAADGRARAALVWCVAAADDPVRGLDDAQRLAVLNTVFPAAAGGLVAISPLKSFALGLNAERTLVRGRVVRIGNAAQTLHPVAGQGLNLGLRDAHALVAALRWAPDLDRALARAEWARAPDRWALIAATDFLARSFTWRLPGATAARGLGLAALQALPPLRQALARQMMFGRR